MNLHTAETAVPMRCRLVCIAVLLFLPYAAAAETDFAKRHAKLQPLALHYGINHLVVGKWALMIVRGNFNTAAAGGGDAYSLLARAPEDRDWKMVRYEAEPWNKMLTVTEPHTGEDSVLSVRFLIDPEQGARRVKSLYLQQAERMLPVGASENGQAAQPVKLTLFHLRRDADFGIFYLQQVDQTITRQPYCNTEWALHQELQLALPDDETDYRCQP